MPIAFSDNVLSHSGQSVIKGHQGWAFRCYPNPLPTNWCRNRKSVTWDSFQFSVAEL